jgi:hypothetical protein
MPRASLAGSTGRILFCQPEIRQTAVPLAHGAIPPERLCERMNQGDTANGDNTEPDQPWLDDDGRPLATLLTLAEGPGSSDPGCVWFLGRLDVGHPHLRVAAWRVARASMLHRCGTTPAFELWEQRITSGSSLAAGERRRVDPFLTSVFGTPEYPVPADHLEGHVAEVLWHLLTLEAQDAGRVLRNAEGPSFSVTETGGDGLAIWQLDSGGLVFRLWEIKKDTGAGHISRTISRACRQLERRSEEYLAKYASVGSRQHSGELARFYGLLLDLWVDDDQAAGAAVSIATSRGKAPVRRSFGPLVSTFPEKGRDGRLEGLVVAIADFGEFAALVRSYVWRGHSISAA